MDCEGCEYDFFESANHFTIKSFNQIIMAYHANPPSILSKLFLLGFKIYVDGLYIKELENTPKNVLNSRIG